MSTKIKTPEPAMNEHEDEWVKDMLKEGEEDLLLGRTIFHPPVLHRPTILGPEAKLGHGFMGGPIPGRTTHPVTSEGCAGFQIDSYWDLLEAEVEEALICTAILLDAHRMGEPVPWRQRYGWMGARAVGLLRRLRCATHETNKDTVELSPLGQRLAGDFVDFMRAAEEQARLLERVIEGVAVDPVRETDEDSAAVASLLKRKVIRRLKGTLLPADDAPTALFFLQRASEPVQPAKSGEGLDR